MENQNQQKINIEKKEKEWVKSQDIIRTIAVVGAIFFLSGSYVVTALCFVIWIIGTSVEKYLTIIKGCKKKITGWVELVKMFTVIVIIFSFDASWGFKEALIALVVWIIAMIGIFLIGWVFWRLIAGHWRMEAGWDESRRQDEDKQKIIEK